MTTTRLDRVLAQTQRANRSLVHVAHPRQTDLTLCGRTIDKYPPYERREGLPTAPVDCRDCRVFERIRDDRDARTLPELCWYYPRRSFRGGRLPACQQPLGPDHAQSRSGSELHDGEFDSWYDTYLECARCEKQKPAGEAEEEGWTGVDPSDPVDLDDALCPTCRAATAV